MNVMEYVVCGEHPFKGFLPPRPIVAFAEEGFNGLGFGGLLAHGSDQALRDGFALEGSVGRLGDRGERWFRRALRYVRCL